MLIFVGRWVCWAICSGDLRLLQEMWLSLSASLQSVWESPVFWDCQCSLARITGSTELVVTHFSPDNPSDWEPGSESGLKGENPCLWNSLSCLSANFCLSVKTIFSDLTVWRCPIRDFLSLEVRRASACLLPPWTCNRQPRLRIQNTFITVVGVVWTLRTDWDWASNILIITTAQISFCPTGLMSTIERQSNISPNKGEGRLSSVTAERISRLLYKVVIFSLTTTCKQNICNVIYINRASVNIHWSWSRSGHSRTLLLITLIKPELFGFFVRSLSL